LLTEQFSNDYEKCVTASLAFN